MHSPPVLFSIRCTSPLPNYDGPACNNAPPCMVEAPIPLHDTTALAPAWCPTCGHTVVPQVPDTIDRFALQMGLPRPMAQGWLDTTRHLTAKYNRNGRHAVNGRPALAATIQNIDDEDWARTMQSAATAATAASPTGPTGQPHSQGITVLNLACSHCSQCFTLHRRTPTENAPTWCPFCGHQGSLAITQSTPEETCFHVLARQYRIDPLAAEAMYMLWSTGYRHFTYFSDFMAALPAMAAQSMAHTPPTTSAQKG